LAASEVGSLRPLFVNADARLNLSRKTVYLRDEVTRNCLCNSGPQEIQFEDDGSRRASACSQGVQMFKVDLDAVRLALETERNELQSSSFDRDDIKIEKMADEFDRMQQQLSQELAIGNLDRGSTLLKSVKAAIARITDGTFGACLRCEEQIAEKRLKVLPWAAYCVACQERIDRQGPADEVIAGSDTDELAA
jgi:RNA polymerase-binding transcription factor